jgi:hypothetical protein
MQVFKLTKAWTASDAIEVRVSSDTPNLFVAAPCTAIMMVMTPII